MNNRDTSLFSLEGVLPALSQQRGWEEQLDLHSIFLNWHELLDGDIAAHCQPQKIVAKILWIEVENSAWLQQLQFQTVHLLDILNESLRISTLKGLRFCIATESGGEVKEPERGLSYVQPSSKDIADFESQVEGIPDKEIRQALTRFWYLSQACRKE